MAMAALLLYGGIVILLLLHAWMAGSFFWHRLRASKPHGRGLTQEELQKLPCFEYRVEVPTSAAESCAVCLEAFAGGDKCKAVPVCNHVFHGLCVDPWLSRTPICPICRNLVGGKISGDGGQSACGGGGRLRVSSTDEVALAMATSADELATAAPATVPRVSCI